MTPSGNGGVSRRLQVATVVARRPDARLAVSDGRGKDSECHTNAGTSREGLLPPRGTVHLRLLEILTGAVLGRVAAEERCMRPGSPKRRSSLRASSPSAGWLIAAGFFLVTPAAL